MQSRIAFLDYDGVVNTPMWDSLGKHCTYNFPTDNKVNNFQAVQWLSEACQKFHYDIVVTSSWRTHSNYKECLVNGGLRSGIEILGRTDSIWKASRGDEIKKYIDEHPEIQYYIIIDDEADILPEQCGHFVMTNGDTGFNFSEFKSFEEIFKKDNKQGGSFPEKERKDYRE